MKTLLCVVDSGGKLDDARLAAKLAAGSESHLSFAVIGVLPPPPAAIAYAGAVEPWIVEQDAVQKETYAKAKQLEKLLQEADVSGDVSLHCVAAGGITSAVGMRARYCDLAVVFAETAENAWIRGKVLKGLLFESGVPFLSVPAGVAPILEPERVVLAWNGTLEATRAVHATLDVLVQAKAVTVAMVDPQEDEWKSGAEPGFDIASYLVRHGIRADVERLPGGGCDISEILLRCARDRGADLLVMGAYGHSRLREYVFGGTTREMLEDATVPLLMMH